MIKCFLKLLLLKYQELEGFHVGTEEKATRTMLFNKGLNNRSCLWKNYVIFRLGNIWEVTNSPYSIPHGKTVINSPWPAQMF